MAQNKRMEKTKKMEELKVGSHKLPRQFDNPCLIATMDLIPLIRPFASCSKSYEFKREKCSHKRIQSNFYYIKKVSTMWLFKAIYRSLPCLLHVHLTWSLKRPKTSAYFAPLVRMKLVMNWSYLDQLIHVMKI